MFSISKERKTILYLRIQVFAHFLRFRPTCIRAWGSRLLYNSLSSSFSSSSLFLLPWTLLQRGISILFCIYFELYLFIAFLMTSILFQGKGCIRNVELHILFSRTFFILFFKLIKRSFFATVIVSLLIFHSYPVNLG